MRCLLVFEPPDGGVAEHVARLAVGVRSHGFETVVAGPQEALIYPALREARVPLARVHFERRYRNPAREALALRQLIALLRGGGIDLVHAHSTKAGILGRLAAVATATPVVYTPHCFAFVGRVGSARRGAAIALERALGLATDAVICVAEHERQLALRHRVATPSRLHVVHNGTTRCPVQVDPDARLEAFSAGGPLAATICVLRPQKAVHVFLEAAPTVLERLPVARLAVVGNGMLRAALEARARELGLDERVRFFDFVPPATRQLRSIDVFVLSSDWEALPISLLEAMACGVPQVATNVGGTPEAVVDGETGLLSPAGDARALADRIVTLLRDPARRARMAQASRRRYTRHFSVERMLAGTTDVYRAVVNARASSATPDRSPAGRAPTGGWQGRP